MLTTGHDSPIFFANLRAGRDSPRRTGKKRDQDFQNGRSTRKGDGRNPTVEGAENTGEKEEELHRKDRRGNARGEAIRVLLVAGAVTCPIPTILLPPW
jgi:hypothetical protein